MKKFNFEYKYFITTYVLPLMGLKNNNLEDTQSKKEYKVPIVKEEKFIIFSSGGKALWKLPFSGRVVKSTLNFANCLVNCFNLISEYNFSDSLKLKYPSKTFKEQAYEYAVQQGIIQWVFGAKNKKIEELLSLIEKWATKTYEGKKVAFAFIISKEKKGKIEKSDCWLKFLRQDLSAVFTDGVSSAIELDNDCNFIKYLSTFQITGERDTALCIPFRFSDMISKCIPNKKAGIFLLTNGDIFLVKQGQFYFVKRNSKWLNFSYEAFENVIRNSEYGGKITKKLLQEVYTSILDVSFSHAGGIISVVSKNKLINKGDEPHVLHVCDDISNGKKVDELEKILVEELGYNESRTDSQKKIKKDIDSRLLKREIVKELVDGKIFNDIDRKLRSELISLDGASLIDFKGKVISFGAIIQNNSGSSGGGRGAAAKKLSNYGIAVKISTDGYIELYIDGKCVYEIK